MNINIVTDLLKEENVVSIDLLLVTGKLERAKEIDVDKSSENLLFVKKPKNKVINLNHVVKIETVLKFEGNVTF
ncbi:hypothetical protein [Staphylococcus equorum]|uniref:hypothetical protein n=1 Tax=Staphylococcus equorum TaxID=246432 RepID=UPI002DBE2304|nr:hypothetical protein [Staphylococcus equorum]MEB7715859.1 hypothetical protein [Staphylococcus equorum]